MSDVQMPDGLTPNDADCYRRRLQGGQDVDPETGRREVVDLFAEYVRRAGEPAGPTELRGRRKEWKAELKAAREKRAYLGPKLTVSEEVLDDVQVMCFHYGTGAQIRDAVTSAREVSFDADRWLVNVEPGRDGGRDVLTLWHLKRRDEGRSVRGGQTWGEAMGRAVKRWTEYQEMVNGQVDRIEAAALHFGLLDHVLRLHREGRLPTAPPAPSPPSPTGRRRESDPEDTWRWWLEAKEDPRCRDAGKFIAARAYRTVEARHNEAAGRTVISDETVRKRVGQRLRKPAESSSDPLDTTGVSGEPDRPDTPPDA